MKKDTLLYWYGALFAFIFFADRLSKWWALDNLSEQGRFINQFLSFELVYNRGVSWGLFNSQNPMAFVLVSGVIALIMVLLIIHAIMFYRSGYSIVGHVAALAGAASNMMDRFCYGGVVDFIVLSVGDWSWPIFNVADAGVVVGVIIIMIVGCKRC